MAGLLISKNVFCMQQLGVDVSSMDCLPECFAWPLTVAIHARKSYHVSHSGLWPSRRLPSPSCSAFCCSEYTPECPLATLRGMKRCRSRQKLAASIKQCPTHEKRTSAWTLTCSSTWSLPSSLVSSRTSLCLQVFGRDHEFHAKWGMREKRSYTC